MPVKGPHNRKSIAKATWVAVAVRMSNEGHSVRSIATSVQKSSTTVWEALQAEFERVRPPTEELQALRDVQRAQIGRQLQAWIPRSIKGDHHAAIAVARFLERAARLDGLDAPSRAEIAGKDGGPIVSFDMSKLTDEQIERIIAGDATALEVTSGESGPPEGSGEG